MSPLLFDIFHAQCLLQHCVTERTALGLSINEMCVGGTIFFVCSDILAVTTAIYHPLLNFYFNLGQFTECLVHTELICMRVWKRHFLAVYSISQPGSLCEIGLQEAAKHGASSTFHSFVALGFGCQVIYRQSDLMEDIRAVYSLKQIYSTKSERESVVCVLRFFHDLIIINHQPKIRH